MQGNPLVILLVEDNPDHTELILRNFSEHRIANAIYHVADGQAAIDFLFRSGRYRDPASSPRPSLILLDLRLPKIDGLEVLKKIKAADQLSTIPVVILTTSSSEKDMLAAYEHHVNSYLVKPIDFDKFTQLMKELGFYWLAWNKQPFSSNAA
jgi:CheY-like chemotaxis protein